MEHRIGGYDATEGRIASLAARQHGVISRAQALEAGLTRRQIERRLAKGEWRSAYRGIYVARDDSDRWRQSIWAALLWLGPGAVVSHRTAAALFRLAGFAPGPVEVSVCSNQGRRCDDLTIHRVPEWQRGEIGTLDQIPITSLPRTIADLAAVSDDESLEGAIESALRRDRHFLDRLRRQLERRPGRRARGAPKLRMLLDKHQGTATGSALELEFERFCRRMKLPVPIRQFPIVADGRLIARVDFAYPNERIAIELDSFEWHAPRNGWDRDVDRYNEFAPIDWKPLRVTSTHMRRRGEETAALIRETIAARSNRLL